MSASVISLHCAIRAAKPGMWPEMGTRGDGASIPAAVCEPAAAAMRLGVEDPASTAAALICEPRDAVVGVNASVPVVADAGPAAAVPTSTPLERRDEDDPLRPLKDLPLGDGVDARLDAATFEESFQVK